MFNYKRGKLNHRALAIHYKAMYKGVKTGSAASQSESPHKINYGCVHPPILHLDTEICSSTYELWKVQ